MLSLKRLLYIVILVAALGCVFLLYTLSQSMGTAAQSPIREREFLQTVANSDADVPRVLLLQSAADAPYDEITQNIERFCKDIQLEVSKDDQFDVNEARDFDVIVFCDRNTETLGGQAALAEFIAEGGRVVFAAGLSQNTLDAELQKICGVTAISARENYHDLVFEKPLLPLQPDKAYFSADSDSAEIEVGHDVSVYIRDEESETPILSTNLWQNGGVCLINGSFLQGVHSMGLFTGALGTLMPNFIYPVFGIKAVFLDRFPAVTDASDKLCKKVYGYSVDGFVRDVVWPSFQGVSLRCEVPYTASIVVESSSAETFDRVGYELFSAIDESVLQFNGELVYAADCPNEGEVVLNQEFVDQFKERFPGYVISGLALETGSSFSEAMLNIPGSDIKVVRTTLGNDNPDLSVEGDPVAFPAATEGNTIEDGTLFNIISVLGAYGLVSHVFDVDDFVASDESQATWNQDKKQISMFESDVLAKLPWLEGKTLQETVDDVVSYRTMDYGWTDEGDHVKLDCSGAVKGQAFLYHSDKAIASAEGLTYEDVGGGYYLLHIQSNHGTITLNEGD